MIVVIIVNLIFCGIGLFLKNRVKQFKEKGYKTEAEIVKYISEVTEINKKTTTIYYPRFKFKNEQGETIEKTHDIGLSIKSKLPKTESIYYLKDGEDYKILINSIVSTSTIPNLFLIFGGSTLIICIFIIISALDI